MSMKAIDQLKQIGASTRTATTVFARDVGHGLLEISHNSLAAVGLAVVAVAVFFSGHGELRRDIEVHALDWLQARHATKVEPDGNLLTSFNEPDAVARATAADPAALSRQQAAVAQWISRRYRVAPEPVARLVQEAWAVGQRAKIEPTLILAIMAIESSFNPFAQSPVGAQGLMQVMTQIHDDKYEPFGGTHAAFDPVTNLRVGVQVLKECIARAGGLEEGLRYYVGAANLPDDGGYAGRVLTEHAYMKSVAEGRTVAVTAPSYRPALAAPATATVAGPVATSASAPLAAPTTTPVTAPSPAPATATEDRPADGRVALLGL
jgi:hypothetical protein